MPPWIDFSKPPNGTSFIGYLSEKFKKPLLCGRNEEGVTVLCTESFEKMKNLKLLLINYVELLGNFKYMPAELRWLGWRGCPLATFPTNLPAQIRGLDLSESNIQQFGSLGWLWFLGMTSLVKLHADDTTITELPKSLFHLAQLESLSLNGCQNLRALPDCLGMLTSLKELNLIQTMLGELPESIGELERLEKLSLAHCTSLATLPDSVGNLTSLVSLHLDRTSIEDLPESVDSLSYLKSLSLAGCRSLTVFPLSRQGLASLIELKLDGTSITELPDHICSLKFLKELLMTKCTLLERLPESIGKMSSLSVLSIVEARITKLPESIGELENLRILTLSRCNQLCKLPDSIGKLSSLIRFIMDKTGVTSLPESFGLLRGLVVLQMNKQLPLESHRPVDKLQQNVIPASFCNLTALEEFEARACKISGKIDDDLGNLSRLELLDLSYNDFHSLPRSMDSMYALKKLLLRSCEQLTSLPPLPSTLVELNAADCYALESIYDVSNLENLQELQVSNCQKLMDVPGLESLTSLRRLYMGCCQASASAVRGRLNKVALRNLSFLVIPGSEIPTWFSPTAENFTPRPNLSIKSVLVGVIISVDFESLDEMRAKLPSITDIQARIIRQGEPIFTTVLPLLGLPMVKEDQFYLCRFKDFHPLVKLLGEGDTIQVGWRFEPVCGIELKSWGIHLVFENDDDYDGNEHQLTLPENQLSVSHRLGTFLGQMDQR